MSIDTAATSAEAEASEATAATAATVASRPVIQNQLARRTAPIRVATIRASVAQPRIRALPGAACGACWLLARFRTLPLRCSSTPSALKPRPSAASGNSSIPAAATAQAISATRDASPDGREWVLWVTRPIVRGKNGLGAVPRGAGSVRAPYLPTPRKPGARHTLPFLLCSLALWNELLQ